MFAKFKNFGRKKDLRGTWLQALKSLFLSILLILGIRWAFIEPYIIPSGSMVPTLLIHDHIFVNKFAYGVRLPFTQKWIFRFGVPQRGEIIVFRSVEDPQIFLIKRIIGLPGDEIAVSDREVRVNGVAIDQRDATPSEQTPYLIRKHEDQDLSVDHDFKIEKLGDLEHVLLYWRPKNELIDDSKTFKVPSEHYFMMGDNRDHSSDSRAWGTLPFENILGRASVIWLSCEKMAEGSSRLCDFSTLRSERLFSTVR